MDNLKSFRILQFLLKGVYKSEFYTYVDTVNEVMHFRDSHSCYISCDGESVKMIYNGYELENISELFCMFIGYIGDISEELFSSPSYTGCIIGLNSDKYSFKKYGKNYELIIRNCMAKVYNYEDAIFCRFDDFVRIILQTTNTKSARTVSN